MQTNETRFLCTLCGYIHKGAAPPDKCPVCGATSELFEIQDEPKPTNQDVDSQWICMTCGYVHSGPTPPETCPVCGVGPDQFEPYTQDASPDSQALQNLSIVILGAGIAGVSAAESIRGAAPAARVTLVSNEPGLPYFRLNLTRYLAGEIASNELYIHPEQWYRDNNIELRASAELTGFDPKKKQLTLNQKELLTYDRLILAMGTHAFIPPIPGADLENVTPLRTLQDADFILGKIRPGLRCVIIGGGVLGLEAAGSLAKRDVNVTVLEGFSWLMSQQLNRAGGDFLTDHVKKLGISIRTDARIASIDGAEQVNGVVLENGEHLQADLVIISAGVRPNSLMPLQAGLSVNRGVIVDDYLRTKNEDIFAAGDLSEHRGVCYGLWTPAQLQGKIAGLNAVGGQMEFSGIPRSNGLKVLNFDLFSIGKVNPDDADYITFENGENGHYRYFVFRDEQLVGAVLMGDTSLAASVKRLIETKTSCATVLNGNPDTGKITAFIKAA